MIQMDNTAGRMKKIGQLLDSVKADAFLVTNLFNIKYLTGFTGTLGYLLLSAKRNYFITDSRYYEYAVQTLKDFSVILLKNDLTAVLKDITKNIRVRSLAYEYSHVSHVFFNKVVRNISEGRIKPGKDAVEILRSVKSPEETAMIEKACRIIASCVSRVNEKRKVFTGLTEKDMADEIENMVRKQGASSTSFTTIVAEGSHSSRPHHHPSAGRKVRFSPLLIDAGATVDSYNSDLTRTFASPTISRKFKTIYSIVLEAQQRAVSAVRPGVPACDVDRAAREFIKNSGYGEHFGHGLGHGIGLEVHERPGISPKSRTVLKKGMVFSVEPGIYLPGLFGCRIEDIVVVTDSGCRVLTRP